MTATIQELQAETKNLQDRIKQYEEKISALEEDLKKEKENSADLRSQLEEEIAKRKEAESVVANLSRENADLKADLQNMRLLAAVLGIALIACIAVLAITYWRKSKQPEK